MTVSLPSISKEDLLKPVQAVLQNHSAEPSDWQIKALAGGMGNAVSMGVYLVTGTAHNKGQPYDWKVVLKMICLPGDASWQETSSYPDQFNYWRREASLLESDLFEQLPELFTIPKCYGVIPKPDNIVWLWLEHFDNPDDGLWNLERYARIANLSGQFGGYFLQQEKLPDHDWLNRNFFRQWVQSLASSIAYWHDPEQQAAFWNDSHIQALVGDAENNALYQFMQIEDQILDKLDEIPKTICHGDFYRSNLMARNNGTEEIILIDWAYIGLGSLGEDLSSLAFSSINDNPSLVIAEADKLLFDEYLNGLRQMGWQGDVNQLRFAYTSSLILRISYFWLYLLHFSDKPLRSFTDFAERLNEETVTSNKRIADILSYYARQALDLMEQS